MNQQVIGSPTQHRFSEDLPIALHGNATCSANYSGPTYSGKVSSRPDAPTAITNSNQLLSRAPPSRFNG